MANFHTLRVSQIKRLTPKAVAISFDIPEALKSTFSFSAGQYITLKKTLQGEDIRRAYSISSAPTAEQITIGVKKVEGGAFSSYANSELKEGDMLEVMPPEGRFVFEPTETAKTIAAFAAGSGITPIMSIARTVLEKHPESTFVLTYGNQSVEETMFASEIAALQATYPDRFHTHFIHSRTREEDSLFGRIDDSTVNYVLKNKHNGLAFDAFYLCGPEEMIKVVEKGLSDNGTPQEIVHFELFTAATETVPTPPAASEGETAIEVVVDDETFSFTMDQKMLVLDAVLKENIDAPYSCQGGVCSSCIAKVTEGKAEMVKNQILTDAEIADGFILTCQAHATTPTLKVDYDDV
ncbi:2Fe-2S iron-sulfur cluster-binding protein [Maribacter sp. 2-571]|uniref:2Fe-2S iron-sulfur cluster-binding protein n=1 Tax=Maribacter sp. 2-571 TaxID=3417569 RepID=UPI003D32DDD7